jgi:hypothetical protein
VLKGLSALTLAKGEILDNIQFGTGLPDGLFSNQKSQFG